MQDYPYELWLNTNPHNSGSWRVTRPDPTTSWPCKQPKTKIWLVQKFKPRRFENVRFFLIWPDSATKLVLESLQVVLVPTTCCHHTTHYSPKKRSDHIGSLIAVGFGYIYVYVLFFKKKTWDLESLQVVLLPTTCCHPINKRPPKIGSFSRKVRELDSQRACKFLQKLIKLRIFFQKKKDPIM